MTDTGSHLFKVLPILAGITEKKNVREKACDQYKVFGINNHLESAHCTQNTSLKEAKQY